MNTSTEQIAGWILIALQEEGERNSSLLTGCTESSFFSPIMFKHTIKNADIRRDIRFLIERRMINSSCLTGTCPSSKSSRDIPVRVVLHSQSRQLLPSMAMICWRGDTGRAARFDERLIFIHGVNNLGTAAQILELILRSSRGCNPRPLEKFDYACHSPAHPINFGLVHLPILADPFYMNFGIGVVIAFECVECVCSLILTT